MNSRTGFERGALAAVFLLSASASVALTPNNPGDQKIVVVKNTELNLRPSIGEKLPPGQATVLIQVDAAGKLMDAIVVNYTHPYYAEAVVKALPSWEYKPATKDGEPVVARSKLVFHFDVTQQILQFTRTDLAEALWANAAGTPKDVQCIFPPKDLDEAPRALKSVHPLRIAPPGNPVPAGRVLIDFFIDQTGTPRMPAAVQFDDERMAGSALQAISQWRFSPPLRKGQPVVVQAQQWFEFAAEK